MGGKAVAQPQISSNSSTEEERATNLNLDFSTMKIETFLGQGLRSSQEDVLSVTQEGDITIIVVADGHSGSVAANWICENMAAIIVEKFVQGTEADRENLLVQAFKEADEKLLQYLKEGDGIDDEERKSGAACSVLVLAPAGPRRMAYVANIGDCHIVASVEGTAKVLTQAHRVYGTDEQVQIEIKRIESVGGWVQGEETAEDIPRVLGQLAVGRAFGDPDYKLEGLDAFADQLVKEKEITQEHRASVTFTGDVVTSVPYTYSMELGSDVEFLHMGSDGVWDAYRPSELTAKARNMLKRGKDAGSVCQRLSYQLRATQDNTAYVLIDLLGENGPQYWKSLKNRTGSRSPVSRLFGGSNKK